MSWFQELLGAKKPPTVLTPFKRDSLWGWSRTLPIIFAAALAGFCLFYGFTFALTAPFLLIQFFFPVLIVGAVTIWALPVTGKVPTGALDRMFFAFFVIMIIWPNYLAIALPGLPWITMVRLTGFPLTFLLAVSVSMSRDVRSSISNSFGALPFFPAIFVGFIIIQIFSIFTSASPIYSLNRFVVQQISWTVVFFTSCYVFLTPGRAEKWAGLIWLMTVYLCALAIWEYRIGHVIWAGHIPSFLRIEDESVNRMLAGSTRSGINYRSQATFSTALGLAEYLALAVPFLIYFVLSKYSISVRSFSLMTIPVVFLVIILTDSRLGVVGFFIDVIVYGLLWGMLHWRNFKTSILGPAIVLAYPALFTAFIAATIFIGRLRVITWGGGKHAASNDGRALQNAAGIPLVLKRPWGYGIGDGAEALGFRTPEGAITIDNYYLLVALDYGIVGFILYYGAIALVIGNAAKYAMMDRPADREMDLLLPLTASLTSFFVIKSIFSQTENHPLAFMMMGMVCALVFRLVQQQRAAGNARVV